MALIDYNVRKQLGEILQNVKDDVNLLYFTQEFECQACRDARSFVDEISSLSDKINYEVYEFVKDKEKAEAKFMQAQKMESI